MDVLRVFNNNVVLAKDGNGEVILTGRGIGFQAKPGQHVDDAKIVRRFVPADGKDPDHMAQQVAGIPPEIIRLVTDAMNRTGLKEQADRQPALVLALSDHVCGAIRRSQNKQTIEYPLEAEVRSLYASEYAKGKALVRCDEHVPAAPCRIVKLWFWPCIWSMQASPPEIFPPHTP